MALFLLSFPLVLFRAINRLCGTQRPRCLGERLYAFFCSPGTAHAISIVLYYCIGTDCLSLDNSARARTRFRPRKPGLGGPDP